jgi:hypothetical protein
MRSLLISLSLTAAPTAPAFCRLSRPNNPMIHMPILMGPYGATRPCSSILSFSVIHPPRWPPTISIVRRLPTVSDQADATASSLQPPLQSLMTSPPPLKTPQSSPLLTLIHHASIAALPRPALSPNFTITVLESKSPTTSPTSLRYPPFMRQRRANAAGRLITP